LDKIGRITPPTNGQKNLEIAVSLLEQEELLDMAVNIFSRVIPGVARVVIVGVKPTIP
jgi:hypothetical protein